MSLVVTELLKAFESMAATAVRTMGMSGARPLTLPPTLPLSLLLPWLVQLCGDLTAFRAAAYVYCVETTRAGVQWAYLSQYDLLQSVLVREHSFFLVV
jgi:hypothetical protein